MSKQTSAVSSSPALSRTRVAVSAPVALALTLALAACSPPPTTSDGGTGGGTGTGGGGTGGAGGGVISQQSVGGTLTGLDDTLGDVKLDLGAQHLTLQVNGAFAFPMKLNAAAPYDVQLVSAPTHQRCTLDGGTGVITAGIDVTDVSVSCELASYFIGGTVLGLDVDRVTLLEMFSGQFATADAGQTSFRFAQPVPYRSSYDVSVRNFPSGYLCTVDGGSGTVTGDVTSIEVACAIERFTVGGTLTGLDAGGLVLSESTTMQLLPVDAGSTAFTFAQPIAWGTVVSVGVSAQPVESFCRVGNAGGAVLAPRSDVTVDCKPGSTVGGTINGLTGSGLMLRESDTGQTLTLGAADGGTTSFDFPQVIPTGESFSVTVAAPPTGQNCVIAGGTGTSGSAPYRGITVDCFRAYPDLIINEISSVPGPTAPVWLELYNGTASVKNLADYQLRAGTLQLDGGPSATPAVFGLPDAGVDPGQLFVISSKPFSDLWNGPQIRFVTAGNFTFFFGDGGSDFVELRAQGGTPIDAVAFGNSGALSAQQWTGAPVTLPSATTDFGKSLARRPDSADTNAALDFVQTDWPTPGGPNDAIASMDLDQDGLPDTAEVPGGRYAGLPLYDWGARTGRRDLFIEVDWVKADGGAAGAFDPGILPRREALQRVHDVMAPHNLELHFDVGDLYDQAPGIDLADMDLGGGNQTPFACTITLSGTAGATSLYQLKAQNADLRRRVSFHYVVFGNSLADVSCGGVGSTGRSEQDGNDVVVTLGNIGLRTTPATELNKLVNWQSSTLMHELGHNLGLRHGGFENRNYKPNYLSIMNYLYQLNGLPVLGPTEGDRYYLNYGPAVFNLCANTAPIISNPSNVQNGRFAVPASFGLDFSNGSSSALNEAALDETKGLGRDGGSVDWSLDNLIQSNVSVNINAANDAAPMCPRGTTGADVLVDNDDWSLVTPYFLRTPAGSAGFSGSPKRLRGGAEPIGDHHTQAIETLVPDVQ